MTDHVAAFLTAAVDRDTAALASTLAPDVVLISPLVGGSAFRGRDDVVTLLGHVYDVLKDLEWIEHYRDCSTRIVVGSACVLGRPLTDAMIVTVGDDGLITQIRPHLRPLSALTAFGAALLPRLARHPDIVRRSLRP